MITSRAYCQQDACHKQTLCQIALTDIPDSCVSRRVKDWSEMDVLKSLPCEAQTAVMYKNSWWYWSVVTQNSIVIWKQQSAVTSPKERNSLTQIYYPYWTTFYPTSISTHMIYMCYKVKRRVDHPLSHKETYQIIFMKTISCRIINVNAWLSNWVSTTWSKPLNRKNLF